MLDLTLAQVDLNFGKAGATRGQIERVARHSSNCPDPVDGKGRVEEVFGFVHRN